MSSFTHYQFASASLRNNFSDSPVAGSGAILVNAPATVVSATETCHDLHEDLISPESFRKWPRRVAAIRSLSGNYPSLTSCSGCLGGLDGACRAINSTSVVHIQIVPTDYRRCVLRVHRYRTLLSRIMGRASNHPLTGPGAGNRVSRLLHMEVSRCTLCSTATALLSILPCMRTRTTTLSR